MTVALADHDSDVVDLATLASLAARIDPPLLRALRLELGRRLTAATEADLWFSTLVEARGVDGIVLRADLLDELRMRLSGDPRLPRAWHITATLHEGISPAVRLEERIAWLACSLGDGAASHIETELRKAAVSLLEENRPGIAIWALRALPRMPRVARDTAAAWLLALGTRRATGHQPDIGTSPPPELLDMDVRNLIPSWERVPMGVSRQGSRLTLGEPVSGKIFEIEVPATNPRYLEVRDGAKRQMIAVRAGATATVHVSPALLTLRTADYRVYEIPPERPVRTWVASNRSLREIQAIVNDLSERPDLVELLTLTSPKVLGEMLSSAELVVYMVTRDILEDGFARRELDASLEAARHRSARIVPVLIENADWKRTGLVEYQSLPADQIPVSGRKDSHEVLKAISGQILEIAETIRSGRESLIVVAKDDAGHFKTIGDALSHATSGDVILVMAGEYRERVILKPGVTIRGESSEKVVIDGGGRGAVVRMTDDSCLADCRIIHGGKQVGVEDCGVIVDGCRRATVTRNRIDSNGHYGVILRRCQAEVTRNIIEANEVLGIYLAEGARFEISYNLIAHHGHSALDIIGEDVVGSFHHNTVVDTGCGVREGNGLATECDIHDNVFHKTTEGISATRAFLPRVSTNIFSRTRTWFHDWKGNRPVKLTSGNIIADARLRDGWALGPGSPAIAAGRDGSDLGAFPFDPQLHEREVNAAPGEESRSARPDARRRQAARKRPSSKEPARGNAAGNRTAKRASRAGSSSPAKGGNTRSSRSARKRSGRKRSARRKAK